jgi:hypothetical protein
MAKNNFFTPLKNLIVENVEPGSKRRSTKTPAMNDIPSKDRPT